MTQTTTAPRRTTAPIAVGLAGAGLALAVTVIHVLDQGGLTALRDPAYLGQGYRLLEVAGVLTAALLLARRQLLGWLLALGVAAGPLTGFILTRTVGLPGARDDIGNWTEPIGVASVVVEGTLLLLSLTVLSTYAKDGERQRV
ncbi:MAG: hypothetical protein ACXV2H_03980 [Actinomycetes bacterium]